MKNFGKGLGSLIPQKGSSGNSKKDELFPKLGNHLRDKENKKDSVFNVEPENIVDNPMQPRLEMDEALLKELASSIKEHGVLQPLLVTKISGSDNNGSAQYQLIAGHRRLAAAKLARLPHVPVIIRDVNKQKKLELALVENIQRADLNILDQAMAFYRLHEEFGLTHDQIAERVGKSREAVSNAMRLLGLPEEIQQSIRGGYISEGHAKALVGVKNLRIQKELFESILKNKLSVRQLEEKTKTFRAATGVATRNFKNYLSPKLKQLQQKFTDALPLKVNVSGHEKHGGRVTIIYRNQEDLDKISRWILDKN